MRHVSRQQNERKQMPKKNGDQRNNSDRRRTPRPGTSRRVIKREEDSTQLLERGEGPTAEEQIDASVDSPSEITNEGGPATDASDRFGGPMSGSRDADNKGMRGT